MPRDYSRTTPVVTQNSEFRIQNLIVRRAPAFAHFAEHAAVAAQAVDHLVERLVVFFAPGGFQIVAHPADHRQSRETRRWQIQPKAVPPLPQRPHRPRRLRRLRLRPTAGPWPSAAAWWQL